jgi:hypothetical protein
LSERDVACWATFSVEHNSDIGSDIDLVR